MRRYSYPLRARWRNRWLATIAASVLAVCAPIAVADDGTRWDGAFDRSPATTELSERFLLEAESARASIPDPIWRGVRQAGWRVALAEYVVDAVPDLKNVRPRGWPANYTWNHTDAVSLPTSRLLVLAEKRLRPSGEAISAERVGGVFRHELGHAFDMIAGAPLRYRSAKPDFIQVYRADRSELGDEARRVVSYYLQSNAAGRQETFAEAFAIILGGGSDITKARAFVQAFPRVLTLVRRDIEHFPPP